MPKVCAINGCNNPVFGKGFCKKHQYLRTDKKPRLLKRTPIRKVSKTNKTLGERKLANKLDKEFFLEIWNSRPHVCFETGEYLGNEPLTVYFHHVLEKAIYPEYRYCDWNIVLVTWEVHSKCHSNIDHAPKVKAYRDKLLENINR